MTDERLVLTARSGAVATLTLNRPARLNALDSHLIHATTAALADLSAEDDVAVIVLSGAGRAFVAGADLRELRDCSPDDARAFITHLHGLFATIRGIDPLVIAAVEGPALGAGCELAAVCDLRIAAASATFGMPEVRVGIPSVIEAALLVPLVGLGRAAELVYTGDTITAEQAERIGLVNRVAPAGEAQAEALALARRLAGYSRTALRLQKSLVRHWYYDEALDRAIKLGIDHLAETYRLEHPRAAMSAFLDRPRADGPVALE